VVKIYIELVRGSKAGRIAIVKGNAGRAGLDDKADTLSIRHCSFREKRVNKKENWGSIQVCKNYTFCLLVPKIIRVEIRPRIASTSDIREFI
jgi:hypothetical protein